jgi:TRAP-type C4-dicarboxylate transport system permease small subunit
MAVMVVDVTWQVASRFLLHAPSSFTEELAGFLLIWIGLMGAAYLAHFLVALFAITTMILGGIRLVRLAFDLEQISAAMGIRMGIVYLALPLSGLLVMVFSLESMAKAATPGEER